MGGIEGQSMSNQTSHPPINVEEPPSPQQPLTVQSPDLGMISSKTRLDLMDCATPKTNYVTRLMKWPKIANVFTDIYSLSLSVSVSVSFSFLGSVNTS